MVQSWYIHGTAWYIHGTILVHSWYNLRTAWYIHGTQTKGFRHIRLSLKTSSNFRQCKIGKSVDLGLYFWKRAHTLSFLCEQKYSLRSAHSRGRSDMYLSTEHRLTKHVHGVRSRRFADDRLAR